MPPAGGNRDEPTVSSESESAARGVSRLSTSVTADYSGLSSSVTAAAVSSKFIHSSIYIRSTGLLLYNYAHIFSPCLCDGIELSVRWSMM